MYLNDTLDSTDWTYLLLAVYIVFQLDIQLGDIIQEVGRTKHIQQVDRVKYAKPGSFRESGMRIPTFQRQAHKMRQSFRSRVAASPRRSPALISRPPFSARILQGVW